MLIVQNYITKDYYVSDTTFLSFKVDSCIEYKGRVSELATELHRDLNLKDTIPLLAFIDLVKKVWYCKATFRPELNLSSIVISEYYSKKEVAQIWLDDYMKIND